jgi:hypothetical protein
MYPAVIQLGQARLAEMHDQAERDALVREARRARRARRAHLPHAHSGRGSSGSSGRLVAVARWAHRARPAQGSL